MRKPEEIATAFAPRSSLDGARSLFLVGIGGAGMSALARLARQKGLVVEGSDSTEGDETKRLKAEGFPVKVGHTDEIRTPDAMVLSDAIDLDSSPEVAAARTKGVPLLRRSQLLGWLLKDRKTIAVTGTHGKTTTTGMTGAGLVAAGLDPLVVVGAAVPQWGGPVRFGDGAWAVVEACEAYDALHDLDPEIVVLTNLEPDHLDFHGDWDRLRASVGRFVARGKTLIYCAEDTGASDIADDFEGHKVGYGHQEMADMALPGRHNALNAIGAWSACNETEAGDRSSAEDLVMDAIRVFTGAERRLQTIHEGDGVTVIDDYAHHPTEIDASLDALRERYPGRRLVVAYQPHLYSRTRENLDGFARSLSEADLLVMTDIYPAREDPIPGISSARIAESAKTEVRYVPSRFLLPREVARWAKEGDVVVGMGAGNISEFAPAFVTEWKRGRGEKKRVAVFYGGDNAEREVSILSSRSVLAALREAGYDAYPVDATETLFRRGDLSDLAGDRRPDCAFLTVHGPGQEDGSLVGLMRLLHLPYTGSGLLASALAMDKAEAKIRLALAGLPVPQGARLIHENAEAFIAGGGLGVPSVVKPNANGSTVGVSFVNDADELRQAVHRAFAYDDVVLVEEWLRGMEVSVPVLLDEVLPTIEIRAKEGAYDFANKYTPGATEEIIPARLAPDVYAETQRLALAAHRALGCEAVSRTDMIVVDDVRPVILETNTLPGMTGTSLLPNAASAAGIPFPDVCARLVQDAIRRYEEAA